MCVCCSSFVRQSISPCILYSCSICLCVCCVSVWVFVYVCQFVSACHTLLQTWLQSGIGQCHVCVCGFLCLCVCVSVQSYTQRNPHSAVMLHMKSVSNGILVRPVWLCCTELRSVIPYQELRDTQIFRSRRGNKQQCMIENKGTQQQKTTVRGKDGGVIDGKGDCLNTFHSFSFKGFLWCNFKLEALQCLPLNDFLFSSVHFF